jgi:glycerol-3-phosphate acyltransferase PlsY
MADFSFYIGELVVAELIYHCSALLLFVGFAYFSYVQLSSFIGAILVVPLVVYMGLLYVTVRTTKKLIKRK